MALPMRAIHPPARAFRAECTTIPAAETINFKTMPENLRDFRINGHGAASASCCGIVAMDRRGARKVLLPIMTRMVREIIPSSTLPEAREISFADNYPKPKLFCLPRCEDLGMGCMYSMMEPRMEGGAKFSFGAGESWSVV